MFSTLNPRALLWALVWTAGLLAAVLLGSRNLQNFDGALVAYLFGTLFACFGIVYRYAVWLERPPTRLYWRAGWRLLFSRRFPAQVAVLLRHVATDLVGQTFIFRRSAARGVAHWLLSWGCLSAFAITLPLTFGWVHFTLAEGRTDTYVAHLFGFAAFEFPIRSLVALGLFHALNLSSVLVIAGVLYFVRRRLTEGGQLATQTFEMDFLPLVVLLLVALTGLGLTWDYEFMQGRAHAFMAITHAISVILLLVWLPFGKFFHLFQRPAQLGVALYRRAGEAGEQAICPHTGEAFASRLQVEDLKRVTREVGFDFTLEGGGSHLDLSPQGKRAALARAHLEARRRAGTFFG